MPELLDDEGKAEWNRIIAELSDMGLLCRADRAALTAYCTAWSRWRHAEAQTKKFGEVVKSPDKGFPMKSPYLSIADQALETVRKFLIEFGLTPSSRSRVRLPVPLEAEDELDRFLRNTKQQRGG